MPTAAHLVVVHRNRGAVCARTVERFLAQADLTVTVVDNGSETGELADLRDGLLEGVEVVVAYDFALGRVVDEYVQPAFGVRDGRRRRRERRRVYG